MKASGRLLIASTALTAATAYAAPFMAVGDNAELFLTGAASVRIDDNIYLNPGNAEVDDVVWSVAPGVDLVFGKESATSGNFYYKEEFVQYTDNSNQDTSLSSIGFNSKYEGGKTKFDLSATFAQLAQNDNNINPIGVIVRREVSHFHAKPEFGISQKASLAIGISYDKTDYGPRTFSDYAYWALPVDVYFEYSEKLDLSIGLRYRDNDIGGSGVDSSDTFWSIGARGEFTPKLTGEVRVGFNQRDGDVGRDEDGFGLDGNLTFLASDKSSYRFNFANDFSYAGTGDQTEKFSFGVTATNKTTEQMTWNLGVNYMTIDYPRRTDDYVEANLGLTYIYNTYVNLSATYTYRNNLAGTGGTDFENNVFSFGANLRY